MLLAPLFSCRVNPNVILVKTTSRFSHVGRPEGIGPSCHWSASSRRRILRARGNVRTETMRAFTDEEATEIAAELSGL
jgi:hypothetical protein